jgi:hypothetical protein
LYAPKRARTVLCAATHGVLPDAKMSQTPLPAGAPLVPPDAPLLPPATPEPPAIPPPPPDPELALVPPELAPPELVLGPPPELAFVPPELPLTPPELVVGPLELAVVPPELELVPPVLAPFAPAAAPPVPAPELPFVAPFELDPPEQPPAAATAMIAAPARNAGRVPETTERTVRVLHFAEFMRELYYVHARGHASTDAGGNLNCTGAVDACASSAACAWFVRHAGNAV